MKATPNDGYGSSILVQSQPGDSSNSGSASQWRIREAGDVGMNASKPIRRLRRRHRNQHRARDECSHTTYNTPMRTIVAALTIASVCAFAAPTKAPEADARLKHASRKSATQYGWIYVHLQGSPAEIGYQHGF